MRTPGNPETHFTGATNACTGAVGAFVRTQEQQPSIYIPVNLSVDVTVNSNRVFFGNGYFLALNRWSGNSAWTSPDGITWTQRTSFTYPIGLNNPEAYYDVASSRWFVGSTSSTANTFLKVSTDDCETWVNSGALPQSADWGAWGDGKGKVVAVGGGFSAWSTDGGATWTPGGNMPNNQVPAQILADRVRYFNGVWYALNRVSEGTSYGVAVSFDDGVSWSYLPVGMGAAIFVANLTRSGIIFGNTSGNYTSRFTSDGIHISSATRPIGDIQGAAIGLGGTGKFSFAVNVYYSLLAGEDITSFTPVLISGYENNPIDYYTGNTAYGNGRYVIGMGGSGVISFTDLKRFVTKTS